jgi:hypothetical protein
MADPSGLGRGATCCSVCEDESLKDDPLGFTKRGFMACSECGNKRCPKASAHWQEMDPSANVVLEGEEEDTCFSLREAVDDETGAFVVLTRGTLFGVRTDDGSPTSSVDPEKP